MPYCGKKKEEEIKKDVDKVVTVGDMNLAYTVHVIIPRWIRERRYSTIHTIRKILTARENDQVCRMIDYRLKQKGFTIQDIETARFNAYDEFWRRVGQNYEDEAMRKNGDVYDNIPYASKYLGQMEIDNTNKPLVKRSKRGGKKDGIQKTTETA